MAKKQGDGRRVPKAEGEVMRLVAEYLVRHTRGEIPGIVSVSRVSMSADLRGAKVFVSALGATEKEVIPVLKSWAVEIQRYIGDRLPMRYCPKLFFQWDKASEKVAKIDSLLHEIQQQKKPSTEDPDSESEDT